MTPPCSTRLETVIRELDTMGERLTQLGALEGGAGNVSVFLHGSEVPDSLFSVREPYLLPTTKPMPRSGLFLATGSGVRLREVGTDPQGTLGVLVVSQGSTAATLCTAPCRRFTRLTSELNSHIAIHAGVLERSNTGSVTVLHAQPRRLTYLSHISQYQDTARLSRRLLRWQPETVLNLPHGIGVVPFHVPGSEELMQRTTLEMLTRSLVVWAQHGVIAYSERSPLHALDLIEYAEAAADYEYMNLTAGEPSTGLSESEIRRIATSWGIQQSVF